MKLVIYLSYDLGVSGIVHMVSKIKCFGMW